MHKKGNHRTWKNHLVTLANDENVTDPCREIPVQNIPNVNDIEASQMPLLGNDDSNPSHVVSTGDHRQVTRFELDVVDDLGLEGGRRGDDGWSSGRERFGVGDGVGEGDFDGVVNLDGWVRVSDGPSVVGGKEWDSLGSKGNFLDLAELV